MAGIFLDYGEGGIMFFYFEVGKVYNVGEKSLSNLTVSLVVVSYILPTHVS